MNQNFYYNDDCFQLDGMSYERESGRCYYLEASRGFSSECGGKMVRRRTSKFSYEYALNKVKANLKIK